MLATLPFSFNFVHPLTEWILLATGGWALYLGIKAKKTRTGTPEQRKELIPGKFAQRHYRWGSLLLAVMTLGTLGGMAVTYLNNGKLFVGPHLLVGLTMTGWPGRIVRGGRSLGWNGTRATKRILPAGH